MTSINAKQWLKFNLNIYDVVIKSLILEWTWFEFQPLKFQSLVIEPEDFQTLTRQLLNFNLEDLEANIAISYFVDAFSLKLYNVDYPTYCVSDLVDIIREQKFLECGYHGNRYRVAPLHAMDPNINYSILRFLFPTYYGTHDYIFITVDDIVQFLEKGLVYHKP